MTLIKADDTWLLWTVLIGWAAVSIWLEQKYKWAAKVSGAIIALLGALALANLNIIPTASAVYDNVWSFVVPTAIPLLLFQANIKKIWKESGRMMGIFWFAAFGTCIGIIVATMLFKDAIPELGKIAGMMTASYIGGGVNFVAMTAVFKPQENLVNAAIVADNFVMAAFFFIHMWIPGLKWVKKNFITQSAEEAAAVNAEEAENNAASYWGRKEISLKDIAMALAVAVAIAAVSKKVGEFMGGVLPGGNFALDMLKIMLSNQFFLMTAFTVTLVTAFPKFFEDIKGAQEIGTFMVYLFFVVLGVPASIKDILINSPLLFVFCFIGAAFNLLLSMLGGKLFKFSVEEQMLAANATLGGPTTAAALAISKGWNSLVIPALLCGIWGYITGNYFGLFVGNWLIKVIGG
ncbi:MAG TPA: DUF819 family protein [Clostridia bacterium]|nr:DUF819 family protein [Clostridia bacterium]